MMGAKEATSSEGWTCGSMVVNGREEWYVNSGSWLGPMDKSTAHAVVAAHTATISVAKQDNRVQELANELCQLRSAIMEAEVGTPEAVATIKQLIEKVSSFRASAGRVKHLDEVVKSYDKAINSLPKDQLVHFTHILYSDSCKRDTDKK